MLNFTDLSPVRGTRYDNSGNRNEFSETLGNTQNGEKTDFFFFARKPVKSHGDQRK